MPEMDGVTFLREALQRYPDMAIIMLTGMAEVNTAVECLKLGALDYISKPVDITELKQLLKRNFPEHYSWEEEASALSPPPALDK